MDTSLTTLTEELTKIIVQLKPHQNPLSFILLLGTASQGKSTLLRQSSLKHLTITAEYSADLYYNAQGIVLELNETWLNNRNSLLQHTLKALNRCHRSVRITGLALAIDASALCMLEPGGLAEAMQPHAQLLQRFAEALGHRIDASLILTKLDGLAGFSDFFQHDHVTELSKPLGFSLDWGILNGKLANNYRTRFEQFIHSLDQQVIHKMHPARSSLKRTLIREFPLQLGSLRYPLYTLLQLIQPAQCRIQAIYFTSAEQGGLSIDHLNKKIQHEFALMVPSQFPQSTNYRAYFVEGALAAFQMQTQKHYASTVPRIQQWQAVALAGALGLSLAWMAHHTFSSMQQLDDVSKELLAYDTEAKVDGHNVDALYHLSKASAILSHASSRLTAPKSIQQLQVSLQKATASQLQRDFLPALLSTIEQTLQSPQETPVARYQALKIYLMLNEPQRRSSPEMMAWFKQHWALSASQKQTDSLLALLKQMLSHPEQPIPINAQVVRDVRNYLNALPISYLYYTFAKQHFPTQTETIRFEGFTPAEHTIPVYFTKKGYPKTQKLIPSIASTLEQENWVLMRQDLTSLPDRLLEAYNYDYTTWWKSFMQKTTLSHVQTYQQALELTKSLDQTHSINQLIAFIQAQTSPDFTDQTSAFNRDIASQFTSLHLISPSALRDLSLTIRELQPFLMTLSVVNDQGHSAFMLSKARFQGDGLSNPFTVLSTEATQFPEPIASWTKQLADDTWFLLLNDTKQFINAEWKRTVFQTYQDTIADRYPFNTNQSIEVSMTDFNRFFSQHGILTTFVEQYLKPFLDTSQAQWQLKESDSYVLPLSTDMLSEIIRANVITAMFFPEHRDTSHIEFSLQKLNLDPIVSRLKLSIGETTFTDTQTSDSLTDFQWPDRNAKLTLLSIEGNHYELNEEGPWAFFKMLQKVNVLVDEQDSRSLQILFEINGNAGRYLLKTRNQINPFTPGILNGFTLTESIATT
jgi:intracellular multiplication protein IcmF